MFRVTSVCVGVVAMMFANSSALAADVTLKYMSWEPSQVEIEAAAVAAFEKEHNVTVEVSAMPSKEYWPRLSALAASGDMPDAFMMSSGFIQEWAAAGNLSDLSDGISEDELANYYAAAADIGIIDGARVAFPQNWVAPILYYNIDMFEAAGVPIPTDDWTWDDFLSAAKKLTVDKDNDGTPEQYGYYFFGRYAHVDPWVFRNGGRYVNEAGTQFEANEAAVNALGFLSSLISEHGVAPKPQELEGVRQQDVFPLQMAAMYVGGSWRIGNTRKVSGGGFKWGIAQVPVGPDATPETAAAYAWADMMAVAKTSEQPELAFKFIQHMVGAGRSAADFPSGKVPAYIATASSNEWLEVGEQPANKDILLAIGDQNVYTGFTKNWSAWRGYGASGSGGLNGELDEVFNGRKSLEEALEAATAYSNDVLSR